MHGQAVALPRELYRNALLAAGRLPQLAGELLPTEQYRAAHQRQQHQKGSPQCGPEGVPPPVPVVSCVHTLPRLSAESMGSSAAGYAPLVSRRVLCYVRR